MLRAASERFGQSRAVVQPLSTTRSSGLSLDVAIGFGCQKGPASARIASAARHRRIAVSHHGLLCGVSSFFVTSAKSLVGGKSWRCGRGGVRRKSHQIAGKRINAPRTAGLAKESAVPNIKRALLPSDDKESKRLRSLVDQYDAPKMSSRVYDINP